MRPEVAELRRTVKQAADWLEQAMKAQVSGAPDYATTRAEYHNRLTSAILVFLGGEGRVTQFRSLAQRAVVEAFTDAFSAGYRDSGGEDTESEDDAWLTARMNTELGYVVDLFSDLRDKRNEGGMDATSETLGRVDGYLSTLDSVYQEGKLRGAKNKMLTWRIGATEKHCGTCSRLDGQRHSAKWWLARNYRPREPGSTTLECKGYNCDCSLVDDDGNEVTV